MLTQILPQKCGNILLLFLRKSYLEIQILRQVLPQKCSNIPFLPQRKSNEPSPTPKMRQYTTPTIEIVLLRKSNFETILTPKVWQQPLLLTVSFSFTINECQIFVAFTPMWKSNFGAHTKVTESRNSSTVLQSPNLVQILPQK